MGAIGNQRQAYSWQWLHTKHPESDRMSMTATN